MFKVLGPQTPLTGAIGLLVCDLSGLLKGNEFDWKHHLNILRAQVEYCEPDQSRLTEEQHVGW